MGRAISRLVAAHVFRYVWRRPGVWGETRRTTCGHGGPQGQIARKPHVTNDLWHCRTIRRTYPTSPSRDGSGDPAHAMAHARRWQCSAAGRRRTPSPTPNTQSGVSVKSRTMIDVLTKHCRCLFTRVFHCRATGNKKKQSRHRRIIPPRSGLGIVAVRLVFWNAEIQARTSVLLPSTLRSRCARPVGGGARFTPGVSDSAARKRRGLYVVDYYEAASPFPPQLLMSHRSIGCSVSECHTFNTLFRLPL